MFGEHLERRDQGTGAVFDGKGDADFVWIGKRPNLGSAADQKETSVVSRIVFDACGEHCSSVGKGGLLAGDGASLPVTEGGYMLHAACGVVEGSRGHRGMLGEKTTALGQRNRMGQDRPYIRYRSAGDSDEIVADAQQGFPLDLHVG